MNEEKEDPILAAPDSEKTQTTNPNESETNNEDKEQLNKNFEQRRVTLLNNPDYGVILCFLEKFRSQIEFQDYSFHQLEENLLSDQENINRQLIDFHLNLLKRISLGKGAKRDKFVSIITKFAYRYDFDDGEFLRTNGYYQAEIETKLRILKNLLESQFDHNQPLKSFIAEKPSLEVRSQAFGRDRSGASYWLFTDTECFIRVFREETDDEHSWKNIVTDKNELEKLIVLLITDNVVRKKFPEWKFGHESFNSLETSNEFQTRYFPHQIQVKKQEPPEEIKISLPLDSIKIEKNLLISPKQCSSPPVANVKNEVESDHESLSSAEKIGHRSLNESSNEMNQICSNQEEKPEINNNQVEKKRKKGRGRKKSTKKRRKTSSSAKKEEKEQGETVVKPKKRKRIADDEENFEEKKIETKKIQEKSEPIVDEEFFNDDDMPIALRRSRRVRKAATNDLPPIVSSPTKSVSQTPTKKKMANGKSKTSSQLVVKLPLNGSKGKKNRKRGRPRGNSSKMSMNGISSSSDEQQPSEDEEDEYNSDDYLPDKTKTDQFDEELLEEEDEEYVPCRSAKTVAKRRGQMSNENVEETAGASSSCCVCSKADRPECLLLCDDCDDPYHLDCLKPILLSVPDGDWFCPICEHKRLAEKLIEKFVQLIKEHEELEIKRTQFMSKRTNRLANVMMNLDRMVKRTTKKRRTNGIVDSDEEIEEEEEEEEVEKSEDEDEGSVYDFQDEVRSGKSKSKRTQKKTLEPENLGVRSCRRKPQNYRFDDYDKKMKEAMMIDGENLDEIDKDSESEEEIEKPKRNTSYDKDEDFGVPGNKNDDEFAPDLDRGSDESESEEASEFDDESTDDEPKSKRKISTRKKTTTRSTRRKSKRKSDDDSFSDGELTNFLSFDSKRTESSGDESGNEDRRRSARSNKSTNYKKQIETDEEYSGSDDRPTVKRMRYRKRLLSDESFIADDDDYEKIAQKRQIVKHNKNLGRTTISDHLNKLVEEEKPPSVDEESNKEKVNKNDDAKTEKVRQSDDDDDFPDEQEIFKANSLQNLKKNINGPAAISFRPALMASSHSYQHAIVDPTARFAMIRPAGNSVRPPINNGCPSNGLDEHQ